MQEFSLDNDTDTILNVAGQAQMRALPASGLNEKISTQQSTMTFQQLQINSTPV